MSDLFAAVFVALYVGHMVGDHVVQTDWQAANKAKPLGYVALFAHVSTYVLTQSVALVLLMLVTGAPPRGYAVALGLLFSGATHAFIDRRWPVKWLMVRTGSEPFSRTEHGLYLVDQTLHIAFLFAAALLIVGIGGGA